VVGGQVAATTTTTTTPTTPKTTAATNGTTTNPLETKTKICESKAPQVYSIVSSSNGT